METRLYLDVRRYKPESKKGAVLKLGFSKGRSSAFISLGICLRPEEWDLKNLKVIKLPNRKELNARISRQRNEIETILFELANDRMWKTYTAAQVREMVIARLNPDSEKAEEDKSLFVPHLIKFAESHTQNTCKLYMHTLSRLKTFAEEHKINLDKIHFEDITIDWLSRFENYLGRTACKNARNIHLRNIRAVFNDAIDYEITTAYPFRRFKIRPVATRKRSLTVEQLRTLFNYPVEDFAVEYVDMFKLMFMFIGINAADLFTLKDIKDGRIEYYRAKTHRLYSIKVEPEALEIINKYQGTDWLLNILNRNTDYKYYLKHFNRGLKTIGELKRTGLGGKKQRKPLFPDLSSYWSRHTWATIAASLDIPKETIAHALGHGNTTVTDIYIDFDQHKVDEANRRVLDWVLYGKK